MKTLPRLGLLLAACFVLSSGLRAQNIPDLMYYKFDGSGASTPNLATAPPAGTANAALMGGVTQDSLGGLCSGSLKGTGNSSNGDYVNTNWAPMLGSPWTISFRTANIAPSSLLFYMFGDINAGEFRCFTNGVAGPNNWILRGPFADVVAYGGAVTAPTMTTFVYDFATNDIRAYVNGVLVNTVPQSGIGLSGLGPFKVGGYSTNIGLPAGGAMDEFRFYTRALSAAEVAELYNPFATPGFLGVDQNMCPGTPVAISQPWPVSNVLWSNGSTNDTLFAATAGTYTVSLTGACGSGADTITLNSLATTAALAETACDQYTAPSGALHNVSGLFVDTIPNAAGCDSLITVDLTIKNSTTASFPVSVCGPYTSPSGNVWATSGIYADTVGNAAGCDSLITIDLTVKSPSSASLTEAACEQYTGPSGQIWQVSGTYTDTIPNAAGCDSVITVALTIEIPEAAISAQGTLLTAAPGGAASYQWINCATNQPITGATEDTFTPTVTGSYAVIVGGICTDTSDCEQVTVPGAGLADNALTETFALYPNPTTGGFTILTEGLHASLTVRVVNALGQTITEKRVQNTAQVSLQLDAAPGMYYVVLTLDSGQKITKPLLKK